MKLLSKIAEIIKNANADFSSPIFSSTYSEYSVFPVVLKFSSNLNNDRDFMERSLRYAATVISQWVVSNCVVGNNTFTLTGYTDSNNYRFEANSYIHGEPIDIIAYGEHGVVNIVTKTKATMF